MKHFINCVKWITATRFNKCFDVWSHKTRKEQQQKKDLSETSIHYGI